MGFQNAPPWPRRELVGDGRREWQTVAMAATYQPTNTLPQCSMINVTDSDSVGDDSSKARIAMCNDAMSGVGRSRAKKISERMGHPKN